MAKYIEELIEISETQEEIQNLLASMSIEDLTDQLHLILNELYNRGLGVDIRPAYKDGEDDD